jgi:hypothetical protein
MLRHYCRMLLLERESGIEPIYVLVDVIFDADHYNDCQKSNS